MTARLALGLVLAALLAGCQQEASPPPESSVPTTPYYDAAVTAGRWIQGTVIPTEHGPVWPDDAADPDSASFGLGAGVAGTTLFFVELARADGEVAWLTEARRGGNWLLAAMPDSLDAASLGPPENAAGLYRGWAGAGVVLHRLYRASGDSTYLEGAHRVVDLVLDAARPEGRGVSWNVYNDILGGSAGTGLFLLYASREMDRADAAEAARAAADQLIARADVANSGMNWPMRTDRDSYLPNFSHGAAGIGFFLATAGMELNDPAYARAARRTAATLVALGRTDADGAFTLPYGFPNPEWRGRRDIGWAHGPAGTGRFFYRIGEATGDPAFTEILSGCAQAIKASGAPGEPAEGWEPFPPDQRFGLAGAASFLLTLYELFGDEDHLDLGRAIVDDLLARAEVSAEGTQRLWPMEQPAFFPNPGERAEYTGFFHGAAGYGMALLQVDAVLRGRDWTPGLPDTPY